MKKTLFLFTLLFAFSFGYSQDSFSDDFEALNVGDYASDGAANWTTWSGTTGGAEDAPVTDAQAASGTKSIHFVGASGGGPQDVLLLFGDRRDSGHFSFSSKWYIPAGKGAYFNFQGETAPGQTWTINTFFETTGNLNVDSEAPFAFPHDEWFTLGIEANLETGVYEVLVDGRCVGSVSRPGSSIASIDLFPLDATNEFYVDDVSYNWDSNASGVGSYTVDGAISSNLGSTGFTGLAREIEITVSNNGSSSIESATIDYTLNGAAFNETFAFDNAIPAGESSAVTLANAITANEGANSATFSLTSVNGAADEYGCNNELAINMSGLTPAPDRKVWAEEGTGTWCVWCPRGDVFMNRMNDAYPDHFIGIAVHNNDPMANAEWDADLTVAGYPGVVFERENEDIDPTQLEAKIIEYIVTAPDAVMVHEATYDETTRELNVTVHTNFANGAVGAHRLVVGLTEDGVTGTDGGYAQANAYAGGGAGVMGGFETLPNPVPASDMVYNHVARELLTPWIGIEDAFSTTAIIDAGWYSHDFSIVLSDDYNVDNLHIVSAVTGSGGFVDNAQTSTIARSVDTKDVSLEQNITVSPNPTNGISNIRIQLEESADITIAIMDGMGRLISQRNYGQMNGDNVYPFDGSGFTNGIYYVRITANDKYATKKVIINK